MELLETLSGVNKWNGKNDSYKLVRSDDGKFRILVWSTYRNPEGAWEIQNTYKLEASARKAMAERKAEMV